LEENSCENKNLKNDTFIDILHLAVIVRSKVISSDEDNFYLKVNVRPPLDWMSF